MKRFKKILAVALTLTVVCALMVIPASALDYSGSDRGQETGYTWYSSLYATGNTVTAVLTVDANTSGAVPSYLSTKFEGTVYTEGGYRLPLEAKDDAYEAATISIANSINTEDYIAKALIGASCTYYAQGLQVGKALKFGDTY